MIVFGQSDEPLNDQIKKRKCLGRAEILPYVAKMAYFLLRRAEIFPRPMRMCDDSF